MNTLIFDNQNFPIPKPKIRVKRLTEELKNLPVGKSFVSDFKTAHSFFMYCSNKGGKAVKKKIGEDQYRTWRIK